MNMQALAAMDDCEHATGKTLEGHVHGTPQEIISDEIRSGLFVGDGYGQIASDVVKALRHNGYMIVQVVQTGNKVWP